MSNSKKRRRQSELVSSDSDSDDETVEMTRQSPRILSRKNKPSFKLPTRDSVWNTIPSLKPTDKLSGLSPRKSVSNFTKIYNSYNYDDYEDTSEDEDDNFEHSDSSSNSAMEDEAKTPKRVKNYHRRIRLQSSSSDEEPATKVSKDSSSSLSVTKTGETTSEPSRNIEQLLEPAKVAPKETGKISDDESEEEITPKRKHNTSLRQSLLASDDENEEMKAKDECSVGDSAEDDSNDDSDSESSCGDRYSRAANLKNRTKQMFSEFKNVISKKKARTSNPPGDP